MQGKKKICSNKSLFRRGVITI